jgi:purine-nucleoside phosphorylase
MDKYLLPPGKLYSHKDVEQLAGFFQKSYPGFSPSIGLYTGTGFASFASQIEDPVTIPYSDLPFFPKELQTPMHIGEFVLGKLRGKQIILARGKIFLLDGVPAQLIALPVRLFYLLGCRTLIYTNTAGAINPAYRPGDFVFLRNHINLTGQNPLVGERNGEWGPLFFDMSHPYDAELRLKGEAIATQLGVRVMEGVYTGLLGPSFETAAEIEMLRRIGGDLVGMSTIMEVIAARQLGMRVLGIGFISNMGAGITTTPVNNEEVQENASAAETTYARLLSSIIEAL